jgi:hypothetical protein
MSEIFQQLTAAGGRYGKEHFGRWDQSLFEAVVDGPIKHFWARCGGDLTSFEGYLRLMVEGVGKGHVTQAVDPKHAEYYARFIKWRSLLEFWLVLKVPEEVPALPVGQRLPVLANTWNLGENILQQPSWIDRYLLHKAIASSPPLAAVEKQLDVWMEPLLRPLTPALWKPPFDVRVLDGRMLHDDFLPGEMELSAPSVVCVRDRRAENVFGGIFLDDEPCTLLPHHRHLGSYQGDPAAVQVEFGVSEVRIAGHTVPLPHLLQVHSHLICGQGMILASAIDSQRLWLIQCHE